MFGGGQKVVLIHFFRLLESLREYLFKSDKLPKSIEEILLKLINPERIKCLAFLTDITEHMNLLKHLEGENNVRFSYFPTDSIDTLLTEFCQRFADFKTQKFFTLVSNQWLIEQNELDNMQFIEHIAESQMQLIDLQNNE